MTFSKIDLHLHLDGSLNPEIAFRKSKEQQIINEDISFSEFKESLIADDVSNLNEYLNKFDIPIRLLKDKDNIFEFTYDLIKRLADANVRYAEIRFAPQFMTTKNITQEEALLQCLLAKDKAEKNNLKIEINFILCMMILGPAKNTHTQNMETIRLARKYHNKGVCLLDLAGAENSSPMTEFKPYFDLASDYGIPFTIHAGEQGGADNVNTAIDFGAVRIGHGIHAIEDNDVIRKLIDNNIALEVCQTSNIQTKNQESFDKHCLKQLYKAGIKTTINTDNMTVSDITLDDEYRHIIDDQKLSEADIIKMMINSLDVSFASEKLKNELRSEYQELLEETR